MPTPFDRVGSLWKSTTCASINSPKLLMNLEWEQLGSVHSTSRTRAGITWFGLLFEIICSDGEIEILEVKLDYAGFIGLSVR